MKIIQNFLIFFSVPFFILITVEFVNIYCLNGFVPDKHPVGRGEMFLFIAVVCGITFATVAAIFILGTVLLNKIYGITFSLYEVIFSSVGSFIVFAVYHYTNLTYFNVSSFVLINSFLIMVFFYKFISRLCKGSSKKMD